MVVRLLCVALALLVWAPPRASQARPDPEARGVARGHFAAGNHFYQQMRYREALAEFQAGYELSKLPGFLLNIGQCQRKLGDLEKARASFEAYLAIDRKSVQATQARGLIAEVDEELRRRAPPASSAPPAPASAPVLRPEPPAPPVSVESERQVVAPIPAPTITPTTTATGRKPGYKRWWVWTTVGVVAGAGIGVGLGVGLTVGQRSSFKSTLPNFSLGLGQY